ncbi:MAG TPA: NIPSNAP family protein, partial [Chitinophagaceae bacterium]|nr:NIPSNAP family protein [Chitinophagaceae bacterium]
FKSLEQWHQLAVLPQKETAPADAGAGYTNAVYTAPPYTRMESILVEAFPLAPAMTLPALQGPHEAHIYELRSYESATEKYNASKVKMFNAGGEIALFKRLGFNGIFYGEVISGSHMPNLMYLTSFDNRQARDEHWKAFGDDPEWKQLKAQPEYQNNVSKAEVILCHATAYSDF